MISMEIEGIVNALRRGSPTGSFFVRNNIKTNTSNNVLYKRNQPEVLVLFSKRLRVQEYMLYRNAADPSMPNSIQNMRPEPISANKLKMV